MMSLFSSRIKGGGAGCCSCGGGGRRILGLISSAFSAMVTFSPRGGGVDSSTLAAALD